MQQIQEPRFTYAVNIRQILIFNIKVIVSDKILTLFSTLGFIAGFIFGYTFQQTEYQYFIQIHYHVIVNN